MPFRYLFSKLSLWKVDSTADALKSLKVRKHNLIKFKQAENANKQTFLPSGWWGFQQTWRRKDFSKYFSEINLLMITDMWIQKIHILQYLVDKNILITIKGAIFKCSIFRIAYWENSAFTNEGSQEEDSEHQSKDKCPYNINVSTRRDVLTIWLVTSRFGFLESRFSFWMVNYERSLEVMFFILCLLT